MCAVSTCHSKPEFQAGFSLRGPTRAGEATSPFNLRLAVGLSKPGDCSLCSSHSIPFSLPTLCFPTVKRKRAFSCSFLPCPIQSHPHCSSLRRARQPASLGSMMLRDDVEGLGEDPGLRTSKGKRQCFHLYKAHSTESSLQDTSAVCLLPCQNSAKAPVALWANATFFFPPDLM